MGGALQLADDARLAHAALTRLQELRGRHVAAVQHSKPHEVRQRGKALVPQAAMPAQRHVHRCVVSLRRASMHGLVQQIHARALTSCEQHAGRAREHDTMSPALARRSMEMH